MFKAIETKYGLLKEERNLWMFIFKRNLGKARLGREGTEWRLWSFSGGRGLGGLFRAHGPFSESAPSPSCALASVLTRLLHCSICRFQGENFRRPRTICYLWKDRAPSLISLLTQEYSVECKAKLGCYYYIKGGKQYLLWFLRPHTAHSLLKS